jgi:hypothetical protein
VIRIKIDITGYGNGRAFYSAALDREEY